MMETREADRDISLSVGYSLCLPDRRIPNSVETIPISGTFGVVDSSRSKPEVNLPLTYDITVWTNKSSAIRFRGFHPNHG